MMCMLKRCWHFYLHLWNIFTFVFTSTKRFACLVNWRNLDGCNLIVIDQFIIKYCLVWILLCKIFFSNMAIIIKAKSHCLPSPFVCIKAMNLSKNLAAIIKDPTINFSILSLAMSIAISLSTNLCLLSTWT